MTDESDEGGGYGRPPKRYQFKPGQSGNPRGRPKGRRGLKTDLQSIMSEKISLPINGVMHKGSVQLFVLRRMVRAALAGNVSAQDKVLQLIVTHLGVEDTSVRSARLSIQDQALLDDILGERSPDDAPRSVKTTDDNQPAEGS